MTDSWPVSDPASGSALYGDVAPTTVLEVIRPADLLSLSFGLINLAVQNGQLVRADPTQPALILVGLPPQHIAEATLPRNADGTGPAAPSALAGGSQLAFRVPDGVTQLPLNLTALLGWAALDPVPPSQPVGTAGRPSGTDSVLELPYRMLLAVDGAHWQHATDANVDPVTGAAELWRTRAQAPSLHVIYSQDLDPPFRPPTADPPSPRPGRRSHPATQTPPMPPSIAGSLTPADRASIGSAAPALDVNSLTLSALGATTSLHAELAGASGAPVGSDPEVTDWQHIMSVGRDAYVKVASKGRLAPFGHVVTIVTVTERLPRTATVGGVNVAFEGLVQSTRMIVNTPLVDYTDPEATAAYSARGKAMSVPLSTVRLPDQAVAIAPTTLNGEIVSGLVHGADGQPLSFRAVAEDLSGAAVELSLPMVYVQDADLPKLASLYPPPELETLAAAAAQLSGQAVAFVGAPGPVAGVVPDGSVLPVSTMGFDLHQLSGPLHPFIPTLESAIVQVPAVSDLAAGALGGVVISYPSQYLEAEVGQAAGGLFAQVRDPPALVMAAGAAGGLAAPQFAVEALSTDLGPVADLNGLLQGSFDPTKLLGEATFLGGIALSAMLKQIPTGAVDTMPAFVRQQVMEGGVPQAITTSFTWSPALNDTPDTNSPILSINASGSTLTITATITAPLDGSAPSYDTRGTLTNIALTFLGAVTLTIGTLDFHAQSGHKLTLSTGPDLTVGFQDDLSFVDTLAKALPTDGFANGPHVDVDATGVTAGYTVAIPSIGIGILSIENIAFAASLSLPFEGPLGLRVAFSTKEHPFQVSVSFIAGGGFFALDVDSRGVNQIEGALELGADLSVDLVIVFAQVHAMAGFYFGITTDNTKTPPSTKVAFSGFLRVGGSVDLLGLISVSIELYLQLEYASANGSSEISGSASLTLSVHLLFITKSVTLHMEKHFPVPSLLTAHADPGTGPASFATVFTPDAWQTYLGAFA